MRSAGQKGAPTQPVVGLGIAVAVIFVAAAIAGCGGSSNSGGATGASAPAATATVTAPHASNSGSGSRTAGGATTATPAPRINLSSPNGGKGMGAIAEVVKQGNKSAIAIVGHGLPANAKHNAYAVWLYNRPADAVLLGFVNPGVGKNGRLETTGPLPTNAAHFKQLLITVETTANPPATGTHHPPWQPDRRVGALPALATEPSAGSHRDEASARPALPDGPGASGWAASRTTAKLVV